MIHQANKRVPVIAGAGSNNTREAIELTRHAKQAGADAALHITPYYNKPTQEGIYRHFQAIGKEAGLPLVVYNIQSRTGVNITPQTMARLADIPEVKAVKEASGNLAQMAEMIHLCGDRLAFLSGDDGLTLPLLAIGGQGVISVVNNLVPRQVAEVVEAWFAGDAAGARQKGDALLELTQALFIETNPIPVKTALYLCGLIPSDEMRLPLCPLLPASLARLKEVLRHYGLLK